MTPGPITGTTPVPARIRSAAWGFVRDEAGFAQVVTLGGSGHPVGRTASAFLRTDWSVDLVQRRAHRRIAQLRQRPQVLVTWVGGPAPGSANDAPAVFDLGLAIPRAVFVQGEAAPLDAEQTWQAYRLHHQRLRDRGHTRAPDRDRAAVDAELVGMRVLPRRIRLEGFGSGAETHTWNIHTRNIEE